VRLKYTKIEREANAFQQPVPAEMIEKMCMRAFGKTTKVVAAQELGNGEYNNVYLLEFANRDAVILRVAPQATEQGLWLEHSFMRREHILQPYFAPIAPLLPKILMIDFTHQLIERDYMFQTYMPGKLWSNVMGELTEDENDVLWRQFAHIAKTISTIKGDVFGLPYPGLHFATWSEKVLKTLEQSLREARHNGLESEPIQMLCHIAANHVDLIDEITTPCLLHGDLWPFNILIESKESGPTISAVLDADRGYWGDPFADWTFNLLGRTVSSHVREVFWQAFGRPEETLGFHFRECLYKGLHCCNVLNELQRLNLRQQMEVVYADLHKALGELQVLTL
jgi:aminoglycoside phosphotransferase (APT) family kinase protein